MGPADVTKQMRRYSSKVCGLWELLGEELCMNAVGGRRACRVVSKKCGSICRAGVVVTNQVVNGFECK